MTPKKRVGTCTECGEALYEGEYFIVTGGEGEDLEGIHRECPEPSPETCAGVLFGIFSHMDCPIEALFFDRGEAQP